MKRILSFIVLMVIAIVINGCGGTKTVELDQLDEGDIRPPDWYLDSHEDNDFIYAVATSTSKDVQVAVDKTTLMCREELGKRISINLRAIESNFEEETGFLSDMELKTAYKSATNGITEQTLEGTRAKKKHIVKEGELWRAYIMMELPVDQIQHDLLKKLKSHEGLHNKLGNTKTYEKMGG